MSLATRLIPDSLKKNFKDRLGVPNMFWSLQNMQNNGFRPSSIIDIGAYHGEWTKETKNIFPEAKYLMIEAQASKINQLMDISKSNPNTIYFVHALLASEEGKTVKFHEMETASSVLSEHHDTNAKIVQMQTKELDKLLSDIAFPAPDLIKLDTQGYEVETLKGAEKTLKKVQSVLMEVSLLDIHRDCPLMPEVIQFMYERGFVPYDICTFTRRPLDKALWQVDIIFIKKEHPLVKDKRWNQKQ
jgi:FkbM family methyltransferase